MKKPLLSAIIPVYNEQDNVKPLYLELKKVLLSLVKLNKISNFEVIFINDGSRDKTQENLELLKKTEQNLRIVQFRKNFGQTPALKAGFNSAKGDLIVTIDGDRQNDPTDIPTLLEKLNQGYDIVSGWRWRRRDKFTKKIFSKIINYLRRSMIGDRLHDYGCSLKIYRKECVKDLELFGELHRYITAYPHIKGYKIGEVKVNHRPRIAGRTKYRFNRGLNGLLDLFFLKFWAGYSNKPLHFFGRLGIYQWMLAVLIVFYSIVKAFIVKGLFFGPALAFASMLVVTGLLFIIFGFLSEMISRTYFKHEEIFSIVKRI